MWNTYGKTIIIGRNEDVSLEFMFCIAVNNKIGYGAIIVRYDDSKSETVNESTRLLIINSEYYEINVNIFKCLDTINTSLIDSEQENLLFLLSNYKNNITKWTGNAVGQVNTAELKMNL